MRKFLQISNLCLNIRQLASVSVDLGYLRDPNQSKNQRFSISQTPQDICNLIKLLPMRSILSKNVTTREEGWTEIYSSSAAKQRYGIATATAIAVLYLSGTPWLGESWDQDQVGVFLESTNTGHKLLSQFPSISCTFQASPQNSPPASPVQSFQGNQIRNKTIFALGIILFFLEGVYLINSICISSPEI